MHEMLTHIPTDIVTMGNVDPATQFRNGTPDSIREEPCGLWVLAATSSLIL